MRELIIHTLVNFQYSFKDEIGKIKNGRLILAGTTAEECAHALPTSHLIPQGLLAYQITICAYRRKFLDEDKDNIYLNWAMKSSNNLMWMALLAYKCLNRAYRSDGYEYLYDGVAKLELEKTRLKAWKIYTRLRDYHSAIDNKITDKNGVVVTKNYNFYKFMISWGIIDGYSLECAEKYSKLPMVLKKQNSRAPFPRVIEDKQKFFGMHTDQMYSRYIAEKIVNGDVTRYKHEPSKLVCYYLQQKVDNPEINLLTK